MAAGSYLQMKEVQVIPSSKIKIGDVVGWGAYGNVFKVKYRGVYYAAKEIHSILLQYSTAEGTQHLKDSFIHEISICSSLSHPNIVQCVGIYYQKRSSLPAMVMELMDSSLTQYLQGQLYISNTTKMSILHDASLGLCYLHSQKPPIIHRDLTPNNIMIKSCLPQPIAKIGDLGVAKVIRDDSSSKQTKTKLTKAPGTVDFMPPESLCDDPQYGTPMDVFSYGGIALFSINQEWPFSAPVVTFDPITGKMHALTEIERRGKFLNFQDGPFKQLIVACLSNDPGARPSARRIETFLSSFKSHTEEFLVQATRKILTHQKDKVEKVFFCYIYTAKTF